MNHKLYSFLKKKKSILKPHKKGYKSVVIVEGYHCFQLPTKFYPTSFFQG
jgi:hypothetical protein